VLRKLFIFFMATWLPLQAGAALASSLTSYSALPRMHGQADVATTHGHHGGHPAHASDTGTVQHDGHEHDAPGGCERCGLCQFVHGGVMLNAGASLPAVPVRHVFATPGEEPFIAHIPELLQRPPRSAA
jgi:hypothetical protein